MISIPPTAGDPGRSMTASTPSAPLLALFLVLAAFFIALIGAAPDRGSGPGEGEPRPDSALEPSSMDAGSPPLEPFYRQALAALEAWHRSLGGTRVPPASDQPTRLELALRLPEAMLFEPRERALRRDRLVLLRRMAQLLEASRDRPQVLELMVTGADTGLGAARLEAIERALAGFGTPAGSVALGTGGAEGGWLFRLRAKPMPVRMEFVGEASP